MRAIAERVCNSAMACLLRTRTPYTAGKSPEPLLNRVADLMKISLGLDEHQWVSYEQASTLWARDRVCPVAVINAWPPRHTRLQLSVLVGTRAENESCTKFSPVRVGSCHRQAVWHSASLRFALFLSLLIPVPHSLAELTSTKGAVLAENEAQVVTRHNL